jgi:hypothetical protein
VVVPLVLFGMARQIRARGVRTGEIYVLLYAGELLAWQWQGDRFLLPLAPLILSYLGVAASRLVTFVEGRTRVAAAGAKPRWVRVAAALVTLAILPQVAFAVKGVPDQLAVTALHVRGDRLAGYDPTVRDYFAAAAWLGGHSPAGAVVVSRKPQFTYLFSGRKSILYPFGKPEEIEDAIRRAGARYVIYDQLGNSSSVYLWPYLLAHEDEWQVVHHEGDPPTAVLYRAAP